MQILDGRIAKAHYVDELKSKISSLSLIPCLVIIQVGNRPDSDSFIKSKKIFAKKIGVNEIHVNLPENVEQDEVISIIKKYNEDKNVQGIIVQLPLPKHLNPDIIIETIDSGKDVDGLTSNTKFIPATARGISMLFDFYKIDIKDKKVTVLGKSKLVGGPIARMCLNRGAKVTVYDSKTIDTKEKSKSADVLIVAIGNAKFITKDYVNNNQIVIDVGINRLENNIVGDVDFENVKDIVKSITPVPGGVGQMTVLSLFENLLETC